MTTAPSPSRRELWILDSWKDLALFVGTPLLILPALALAQLRFSAESIGLAVATFGATGHHLPGMLRAYGDRQLFRRFRVRFIVAPIFLLIVCTLLARRSPDALLLVVLLWGFWHGLAQVYGFMRIYDAKLGAKSNVRARLDMLTCVAWFVAALLHSPEKMSRMVEISYELGSPVLANSAFVEIRTIWMALTVLVTMAFLAYTFVTWRQGQLCSVVKLLVMASSFSFWWFATVHLKPIILGVAAFEIFHDVQYLAIVWVYNRTRVKSGRPVGAFTQFLFRGNTMLIALYVALVFAYGSLGLLPRMLANENVRFLLYGFVAASALLHYYYDGFIWKIRESSTSAALGVQSQLEKGAKPPVLVSPGAYGGLMHGLKWSPFAVAAVWLLFASGLHTQAMSLDQRRAVVATVPESADAHVSLGNALLAQRHFEEARVQYEEALQLGAGGAEIYFNLGNALQGLKRHEDATVRFQEALRLKADFAEAHFSWGVASQRMGRFADAATHYQEALRHKPDYAEAHYNWGAALRALGQHDEAAMHDHEALRLNPRLTPRRNQ